MAMAAAAAPQQFKYESGRGRVLHTRLIKVVKMAEDPLEPPKFRHRRIPKAGGGGGSPAAAVMHSPPRPVTAEDLKNWKVPPCVSNWKNPKGYVIPMDKRRTGTADRLEFEINQRKAKLAEALYVAEEAARESVALRNKIQREREMKEKERRDEELRELARNARDCAVLYGNSNKHMKNLHKAEVLEEKRRKRRLEAKEGTMMKMKSRDERDRVISERMALGLAFTGREKGEFLFDLRLVDGEKGLNSGFATGDDDHYNVYDKCLFNTQFSTLFRRCVRDRPLEFSDPFGLDQFLSNLKSIKT
ncbi:hypothetical protein Pfo_011438 [Paulownia fortunei]|nr:hypothetical protein Pfo_011438 [Paulownia fortunei]